MAFWKRKRKEEPVEQPSTRPVETTVMDLGDDPIDPHGDGTLLPGDPLFDLLMHPGAKPLLANRQEDGTWEVTQ